MDMMGMSRMAVCGLLVGVWAVSSQAGGISVGTEFRYPTRYEVRTSGSGQWVVAYPTEFTTRTVGTRSDVRHLGVVQKVHPRRASVVRLKLNDGTVLTTAAGRRALIRGEPYQVLGWRDNRFCMRHMRTGRNIYFKW